MVEIGVRQAAAVMALAQQAGARERRLFRDLGGRDRCIMMKF
ncbi:hypothetical protein [Luteithermobacter gelatinilyticus]|nr:hypothetical protein [Luteithermobacter gelatinilyticus]